MSKIISHRGNLTGPNSCFENSPAAIETALLAGFYVEVDVRWNKGFYLGHDEPQFPVTTSFLDRKELILHAKDIEALRNMSQFKRCDYFYHNGDDYVLTARNNIWSYPKKQDDFHGIVAVLPELWLEDFVGDYVAIESKKLAIYEDHEAKSRLHDRYANQLEFLYWAEAICTDYPRVQFR